MKNTDSLAITPQTDPAVRETNVSDKQSVIKKVLNFILYWAKRWRKDVWEAAKYKDWAFVAAVGVGFPLWIIAILFQIYFEFWYR